MSSRAYNYITSETSPNQSSRKGNRIQSITIHWWGKPVGQSIGGIVEWLCNPAAQASAHYVVSGDTVYCIVAPGRKAWHSGSNRGNLTSIGLELDPNASRRATTERTAAALIADLRAVYGGLPLHPHNYWVATECPGNWNLTALDSLSRTNTAAPVPSVPAGGTSKPVVIPDTKKRGPLEVDERLGSETIKALQRFLNAGDRGGADIVVDGKAGPATWRALQTYLGTPVDGVVSHQSYRPEQLGNGITGGWDYDGPGAAGSTMVKALQRWVGVTADGVLGPKTVGALQRKLNAHGVGM
ncbi:N-acetylmuramoyl-L-alanine amidase [Brachybacterium sp. YJGR34]|uniref:N-acetylmuramoyl-L-alanine amidase n=1 Tax=Brachybacterium sp. YJGR34 TaxID=2059911 RepID=UPI000E0B59FD|nr:N-acetylmuramoyl-L-alanine amidase [Brachybacterium sp. YJGR34]